MTRDLPQPPFTVKGGNRIYAADGEEVAVATRASGKYRRVANEFAQVVCDALNSALEAK